MTCPYTYLILRSKALVSRLPASPKSNFMTNFHKPMIHLDATETGSLILTERKATEWKQLISGTQLTKADNHRRITVGTGAGVVIKALA